MKKKNDKEFWARRISARQDSSGNYLLMIKDKIGGIVMRIKHVLKQAGIHMDTALEVIGWLSFITGMFVPQPVTKAILLVIARVLPKALYQHVNQICLVIE